MKILPLIALACIFTGCSQFGKPQKEQNALFGATIGTAWDLMRGEDFGATYLGTAGGKLPKTGGYSFDSETRRASDTSARAKYDKPAGDLPRPGYLLDISIPASPSENVNAVAVIIGNRNYQVFSPDVPDVDFAHNDADLFYLYATRALGVPEGNIIFLKDATQAQLLSTFGSDDHPAGKLADWVRPEVSSVLVFYSGHGVPGLRDGRGYLLPVDADPATIELNGYPLDTLFNSLLKLPTRNLTIVVDACFSGLSANGPLVKNASSIGLKPKKPQMDTKNATIITAASASEVASWDKDARLGLLTRHLIEGLSGKADTGRFGNADRQVTLSELKAYLETEVPYTARRLYGRDQHPEVDGDTLKIMSRLE